MKPDQILAILDIGSRGEWISGAALRYPQAISPASLHPDTFTVKGRTVLGVRTAEELEGQAGHYILLDLSPEDGCAYTKHMAGFGRDAKARYAPPEVLVRQNKTIVTCSGAEWPAQEGWMCSTGRTRDLLDAFTQDVFIYDEGRHLPYNLYTPQGLTEDQKVPLVVFLHDASACSEDVRVTLAQGMGGLVWALPEEQARRPCFVLAPQIGEMAAHDDGTMDWPGEAVVALIAHLVRTNPHIDPRRIYGTGQSMGTMMLCELNLRYPNLFAGCYLVAGQWDPVRMTAAKEQNLWVLVSADDDKAYPTMTAVMEQIESAGGKVARGHVDARANAEVLSDFVSQVRAQGAPIQFTWYDPGTVFLPGMESRPAGGHICTWFWAFGIEPIREWLFAQSL